MRHAKLACFLAMVFLMPARADADDGARFTFHSDARMNLHHFLYHAARNDLRRTEKLWGRVQLRDEDRGRDLGEDAAGFQSALEVYAGLGDGDLLFDGRISRIRTAIAHGETATGDADADRALDALARAMPAYLTHWWPSHDELNRLRIDALESLVARYGDSVAATLSSRYESGWGESRIRVDLSAYANWAGAYGSDDPNHIVISSAEDRHPGLLAMEILFHEASHTMPLGENIRATSMAMAAEFDVEEDDLWHSFIFYATGEAVRSAVGDDYSPYAIQYGLWNDGSMRVHGELLRIVYPAGRSLADTFRAMHGSRAR